VRAASARDGYAAAATAAAAATVCDWQLCVSDVVDSSVVYFSVVPKMI